MLRQGWSDARSNDPMRKRIYHTANVVLAVLVLSGCGAAAKRAVGLTAQEYAYVVNSGQYSPGRPLAYAASADVLFRAEQLARARCMQRAGFAYVPDHEQKTPLGRPTTFDPQATGLAPQESTLFAYRERHGFGLHELALAAADRGTASDPDPDDRYLATLSARKRAAWLRAWERAPGGGCLHVAERQVYGSVANADAAVQTPNDVRNFAMHQILGEARVMAVTRGWTACMRRSTGRPWSNENAVLRRLVSAYPVQYIATVAFLHKEIALAVADTRCAYTTGQAQVYASAFVRAANALPPSLSASLVKAFAVRSAALRRAALILSGRD